MFYEIAEISTHVESSHTWVLVHFWADQAAHDANPRRPLLTNDFLMQLQPTGTRATSIDADGNVLASEDYVRNVPAEIEANIEAYWLRANERKDTGSQAALVVNRTNEDPNGVLARADVRALRGAKRQKRDQDIPRPGEAGR